MFPLIALVAIGFLLYRSSQGSQFAGNTTTPTPGDGRSGVAPSAAPGGAAPAPGAGGSYDLGGRYDTSSDSYGAPGGSAPLSGGSSPMGVASKPSTSTPLDLMTSSTPTLLTTGPQKIGSPTALGSLKPTMLSGLSPIAVDPNQAFLQQYWPAISALPNTVGLNAEIRRVASRFTSTVDFSTGTRKVSALRSGYAMPQVNISTLFAQARATFGDPSDVIAELRPIAFAFASV